MSSPRPGTEPTTRASAPQQVTAQQRRQLEELGFTPTQIDAMPPAEAHSRLGVIPAARGPVISAVGDLQEVETRQLYRLGYRKQQILEMGSIRARAVIAQKIKSGTPVALPGEAAAQASLTDERIAQRDGDAPRPTPGVGVGRDELTGKMLQASEDGYVNASEFTVTQNYEGRVIEGDDYVSAAINSFANNPANKHLLFRVIDPNRPATKPGPAWQPWKDQDGKPFKVGDGIMAFMPKEVHRRAYEVPQQKRSDQMTSAIATNQQDSDLRMNPEDAQVAPILRQTIGPDGEMHNAGAFEMPAHPTGFVDRAGPGASA